MPTPLTPAEDRRLLRLRSIGWALLAAAGAMGIGLAFGLEPALRAGGSGFFYGLLAFHLQRVDPDDGHLQAGLIGAVCGLLSLGVSAEPALTAAGNLPGGFSSLVLQLLRDWWPRWLPLVGGALLLQAGVRLFPAMRPCRPS
ncbi:hypothetical protein KQ313_10365 [Synechococcus sp. CS-1325]|uniref:hypothetical protein n=1 Tax=unclassified Synechococcus TaxID=2626047 RepID=UPI0021A384F3|nr:MULTISPECIES: hypothetical protein [unclassified Synechococcus]MCT0200082.1 hypothetical protein [Synechococcus sp. CS-1325]MCT0212622.1 hypothetical protein [Synechococcus sp. CS-1326]MCT0230343.1 hypothetical protein [Synechococcus sp. CS-1324]MCT0233631.1 hypothetical protein [Synechococcus sp. CS-1327]